MSNFIVEYKTNPEQTEWSSITINPANFRKNWDDDMIEDEIREYVYTDDRFDDDEYYENNCVIKNLSLYVTKVKNYFTNEAISDAIHKEEFEMSMRF